MILCEWDASEGNPGQSCVTPMLVSYRRLSPQFKFSLSGVTLVYLSQWYISRMLWSLDWQPFPFHVFSVVREGNIEYTGWGSTEHRSLKARAPP
jgi:hypothetical protein